MEYKVNSINAILFRRLVCVEDKPLALLTRQRLCEVSMVWDVNDSGDNTCEEDPVKVPGK